MYVRHPEPLYGSLNQRDNFACTEYIFTVHRVITNTAFCIVSVVRVYDGMRTILRDARGAPKDIVSWAP